MRTLRLQICLVGLMVGLAGPLYAAVEVTGLRVWHSPDRTRLVFELSALGPYATFSLSDPARLVLDMPGAQLKMTLPKADSLGPMLKAVRSGEPAAGILRLVLDLGTPVAFRVFTVAAVGSHGDRVVVDLSTRERETVLILGCQWRS